MKKMIALLLLAFLPLSAACGGGGSDSRSAVQGGSGGSSLLVGSFTPGQASPLANTVSTTEGSTANNLVTVDVQLTDINNVFGASFDVAFNPTLVSFVRFAEGDALEAGGDSPEYVVTNQGSSLVVGVSRSSGAIGATNITGTRRLISLTFSMNQAGASTLSFQNQTLLDGQSPPQTIPGIDWFGGQLDAI